MKPWPVIIAAALVIAGAAFLLRKSTELAVDSIKKTSAPAVLLKPMRANDNPAVASKNNSGPAKSEDDPDSTMNGSPLAAKLNAPDGNAKQDVATLNELVFQYQHNMRHPNAPPIGDDRDLARVLTGHNPTGLVIIPPGHRAISSDGRLCDRWGTPYFVHPIGRGAIEIRSAGPDKKMFTSDDVTAEP